tara:strand:- start:175 stop:357 length:183 start_codon:yes stop_codon:yes gene_type:complete
MKTLEKNENLKNVDWNQVKKVALKIFQNQLKKGRNVENAKAVLLHSEPFNHIPTFINNLK